MADPDPDPGNRRRLDPTGRRLVAVETAGFALVALGISHVYDDRWRALASVGVGLIWISQLIDRRTRPGT